MATAAVIPDTLFTFVCCVTYLYLFYDFSGSFAFEENPLLLRAMLF